MARYNKQADGDTQTFIRVIEVIGAIRGQCFTIQEVLSNMNTTFDSWAVLAAIDLLEDNGRIEFKRAGEVTQHNEYRKAYNYAFV